MSEAKTKLLLVEDDPNFGAVLKDYLELHDYEVTLSTDGEKDCNLTRKTPLLPVF